jgi:hypothetical protein
MRLCIIPDCTSASILRAFSRALAFSRAFAFLRTSASILRALLRESCRPRRAAAFFIFSSQAGVGGEEKEFQRIAALYDRQLA